MGFMDHHLLRTESEVREKRATTCRKQTHGEEHRTKGSEKESEHRGGDMRGFARAQRREEEELERKKNAYQEGAGLKWVVGKHCGVFAIEGVLALHERGALAYAARPEKGRGGGCTRRNKSQAII